MRTPTRPSGDTASVARLKALNAELHDRRPFSWLDGRSASDAFVICIGAGPWKFARRQHIQRRALETLAGRDLSALEKVDWYPLTWQNDYVQKTVDFLHRTEKTMTEFCAGVTSRLEVYEAAGNPYGSKVLSLFCRDALCIASFPIDRHVRRLLMAHHLPWTREESIIHLCEEADIDPREMAVACVRAASDMDNPDWSLH
jgi:hypothetical protein